MWVDIDDVRAELERLVRKGEEELAEEEEQYEFLKTLHVGTLLGYTKVEIMLDELEKVYRVRESECVRGLKVKGYEEPSKPEVDWGKVPVDTLVRVRDYKTDNWKLRYFAGFLEYDALKYETWNSGRTSKTADGTDDSMCWRFCELVEEEE